MADKKLSEVLGGWEGYTLGTVGRIEADEGREAPPEVWIELHPIPGRRRCCSGCGRRVEAIRLQEKALRLAEEQGADQAARQELSQVLRYYRDCAALRDRAAAIND